MILAALTTLTTDSLANRPYPPMANAREMVVRFGAYGYVVLYQFVPEVPLVTVLAVKHQRELGYRVP